MKVSTIGLASLGCLSCVSAWGRLGHETVALLAQQYLLPSTITQVRQILQSNAVTPTYMGDVALWADEYRKEPGGEWSGGLHFINGKDAPPPESCKIVWPTDCPPEGCIVKAIGNYTELLKSRRTDAATRFQALKFLIHFMGDVAQPLHTEGYGSGGNNITVFFNGFETNLHAAWDTAIPNSIFGLLPNATITSQESLGWANNLAAAINMGEYQRDVWKWLRYHNVLSLDAEERAATEWVRDANLKVCDAAITVRPEKLQGLDIGKEGEYMERARKVVDMSIARAGVRLAGWLNLIFSGRTGFEGLRM